MTHPSYIKLFKDGTLKQRVGQFYKRLQDCNLCPRNCHVNRLKDQKGFCKTGIKMRVFNYMAHHGEEPPISGTNGSGVIFFSGCNLRCVYCQNYKFSQLLQGRLIEPDSLARFMLQLQRQGCHNINLVSPTHVIYQILEGLLLAIEGGLKIPLVYNTSGYESEEALRLLDGIIDVYLADMRYGSNDEATKYSQAKGYVEINQSAIKEMHRQVGNVSLDDSGIINRGLIIRHLILPNNISRTKKIFAFIAKDLSNDVCISLMSQYLPSYKAAMHRELNRRIYPEEYEEALHLLKEFGFSNGWVQEDYGQDSLAGINIKPNA